jgi:putative transcriptional regulator
MKSKRTVRVERRRGKYVEVLPDGRTRPLAAGKTDWARVDAMTDEEIEAAVRSDPDARLSTPEQLARMRRVPFAKHVRWKVGLSQSEFARRFQIPIGTLRDWEQWRSEPDQAALAYLKVIAADARFVERALAAA